MANSAVQPGDLGTAATTDATDYATAAQGSTADTAVQPGDLGDLALKDKADVPGDLNVTGTPDGSKFLRDDSSWQSIPGGGDMLAANNLSDVADATLARQNLVADTLPGHLWGLTLSNNATDATNDIDIAAGSAADSAGLYRMVLASALTKRLDAAWAVGSGNGGLDTGSIANTTYHIWLIQRSDTGVVDALFSTSATAPTMPANYDRKRRIGSIIRISGAILAFSQDGDEFLLKPSVADVSTAAQSTTAVLYALTVPAGIKTKAIISSTSVGPGGAGTNYSVYISSPDQTDEASAAPSAAGAHTMGIGNYDVKTIASGWLYVRTDTSRQVRARASAACSTFRIQTYGWVDTRGTLN